MAEQLWRRCPEAKVFCEDCGAMDCYCHGNDALLPVPEGALLIEDGIDAAVERTWRLVAVLLDESFEALVPRANHASLCPIAKAISYEVLRAAVGEKP